MADLREDEASTVETGQLWTDPKHPGRRLRVTSTDSRYAYCESWWEDRVGSVARSTRIELGTFRRYELLPEPGEDAR